MADMADVTYGCVADGCCTVMQMTAEQHPCVCLRVHVFVCVCVRACDRAWRGGRQEFDLVQGVGPALFPSSSPSSSSSESLLPRRRPSSSPSSCSSCSPSSSSVPLTLPLRLPLPHLQRQRRLCDQQVSARPANPPRPAIMLQCLLSPSPRPAQAPSS